MYIGYTEEKLTPTFCIGPDHNRKAEGLQQRNTEYILELKKKCNEKSNIVGVDEHLKYL